MRSDAGTGNLDVIPAKHRYQEQTLKLHGYVLYDAHKRMRCPKGIEEAPS